LFSKEGIEVNGQKVRPLDVTAALLFPKWTYEPGEADLTVMRVSATGRRNGHRVRWSWDLCDYYDRASDFRSMSRTTAFTATVVALLILEGRFQKPGVFPPEFLGQEPGMLDVVLAELRKRGVNYSFREESLNMDYHGSHG
jgi:saccharopine dehydrogenase-like NADP-dependent oxidoreductase